MNNSRAKIADFGFATKKSGKEEDHFVVGTEKYISP